MMNLNKQTQWAMAALMLGIAGLVAAPAVFAAQVYSVDYRLTKWKTIHFKDVKKAQLHFQTVKTLGCEAKIHSHGDHMDVTYRCEKWRRINLKNHDAAHQWQDWLKASGFETKHQH